MLVCTESKVVLSEQGVVKFFRKDRGFGFIETVDCDYFFTASGYREPLPGFFRTGFFPAQLPDNSVPDGTQIRIIKSSKGPKGLSATEWTLASFNNVQVDEIYVVIQTDTITVGPVVDNVNSSWKTVTRTNESVVFIGSKEECLDYWNLAPGTKVVKFGRAGIQHTT